MQDRTPETSDMRLFRSKKVQLEDGLQEAGMLVGQEGKIDRILRKDELGTLQHNVEVSMRHVQTQKSHMSESESLYNWHLLPILFILATSSLRLTTSNFYFPT
jgi:hypothetical protein